MRILVTGAAGFAGRCLVEHLAGEGGAEIFGTYHETQPDEGLSCRFVRVSLTDYGDVANLVSDIMPDEVYHLAAVSFMPDAKADRLGAVRVNVGGGANLLEAAASRAPSLRILNVSSAEVYGKIAPSENPVTEERPCAPETLYAATKQMFEILCAQYARDPGLRVVTARPFNHTGPGQGEKFAAPAFASAIARAEAGLAGPVIRTGNLGAERDFTDARDIVRAYPMILRGGEKGGVYNVCSGRPVKIEWILETLMGMSSRKDLEHAIDPGRLRPPENPVVFGSAEKLARLTGWRPSIPLEKTLADLLESERARLKTTSC